MGWFWRQVFYLFHVVKGSILLGLFAIGGFIFNEFYLITPKFWKGSTKAKQPVEASDFILFFFNVKWHLNCPVARDFQSS